MIKPFADPKHLDEAESYIRSRIGDVPVIALILGSGLSYFSEMIVVQFSIDITEIPWFPPQTVEGHPGKFLFGKSGKVPLIVIQGRSHFYEGRTIAEVTFYVQLLHRLGVQNLILTNAAGGIRPDLKPGDFIVLNDTISFTQIDIFPSEQISYTSPFSDHLIRIAKDTADSIKIPLLEGTYCWTTGPSYETPLEIKMMRELGADVVGMSTAPEAFVAAHLNMNVLGISIVTNLAAGISRNPLSHDEVQKTADNIKKPYSEFFSTLIEKIFNEMVLVQEKG